MDINMMKKLLEPAMGRARNYRVRGTDTPHAVEASEHSPAPFGPFQMLSGESWEGEHEHQPKGLQVPPDRKGKIQFFTDIMPNLGRTMIGIMRSAQTIRRNPSDPKREVTKPVLEEIESRARSWGADLIGYTDVDPDYVFQGRRVLDRNVIMLAMEMEQRRMAKAPHLDSFGEVQQIYADLGLVAFKVANLLRKHGFAAEAGPALGGDCVYPPLAQKAGIGWVGRNGLLLTEQFGPRVRLAAVYCSIDNLPVHDPGEASLEWMRGFCDLCRACVRRCPPGAILDTPATHPNGALTYVDNDKCYPFFEANYGCGVCIKVCPFSHVEVRKLRHAYDRHQKDDKQPLTDLVRAPQLVKLRRPTS